MKKAAFLMVLMTALLLVLPSLADDSWVCSNCGKRIRSSMGDYCPYCMTHNHKFEPATCSTPEKCSCGAVRGTTLEHKWHEATCTEPKTCEVCGITEGAVLDHQWDQGTILVQATCYQEGKQLFACQRCGATRTETLPIAPDQHAGSTERKGAKEATCTETGQTGDLYCKGCGKLLETSAAITAKGHVWRTATCTEPKKCEVCGATEGSALGHLRDQGTILQAATCHSVGSVTYVCQRCGLSTVETIPMNPDSHDGGQETQNQRGATCTAAGYSGDVYCKGCGRIISQGSLIPATGHNWQAATYTSPKTCTVCSATEGVPLPTPTPSPSPTPVPTATPKPAYKAPENEFFANGKLKTEYILNSNGYVQRRNTYNRYGYVTSYEISEQFNKYGRILRSTVYFPNSSGKYSEYHYTYTYLSDGTLSSQKYTYADGTAGGATAYERDEQNRIIKLTGYDEMGDITFTNTNYQYDVDNHVIAYDRVNADQTTEQTVQVWSDNVRVYTKTVASNGKVSEFRYDPVYGDSVSSLTIDRNNRTANTWTYDKSEYTQEHISTGENSYHSVSRYSNDGRQLEFTSYRENGSKSSFIKYTYDIQKKLNGSISTGYRDNGSISYQFEQNEQGQNTKYISYDDSGIMKYYEIYEYDSKGLRAKATKYTTTHDIDSFTTYEYDNKNRKTKESTYSTARVLQGYTTYEYDAQNRVSHDTTYYANGNRQWDTQHKYDADGTHHWQTTHYKEDGSFWFNGDWY